MKKILVTGGAGYIGSHAVKALCESGYAVTVLDNLSKGHRKSVHKKAVLVELDLFNLDGLKALMADNDFDAVMHFAGSTEVGLSMENPRQFICNNVMNGANLLEGMRLNHVKKIIFSSTAAVYGDPEKTPIKEHDSLNPTNIYGMTKLMFEEMLRQYGRFYGINYVALRYFNAAGADSGGEIGEDHDPETHLIPNILNSLLKTCGGSETTGAAYAGGFKIFGMNYETKDGTCIRDYIHVTDLVDAHLKALEYLLAEKDSDVFNLGNGNGFSVLEVIKAAEDVTGMKVEFEEAPRRPGDPPVLVADSSKAKKILGWKPLHGDIKEIITDAWRWHKANPGGY